MANPLTATRVLARPRTCLLPLPLLLAALVCSAHARLYARITVTNNVSYSSSTGIKDTSEVVPTEVGGGALCRPIYSNTGVVVGHRVVQCTTATTSTGSAALNTVTYRKYGASDASCLGTPVGEVSNGISDPAVPITFVAPREFSATDGTRVVVDCVDTGAITLGVVTVDVYPATDSSCASTSQVVRMSHATGVCTTIHHTVSPTGGVPVSTFRSMRRNCGTTNSAVPTAARVVNYTTVHLYTSTDCSGDSQAYEASRNCGDQMFPNRHLQQQGACTASSNSSHVLAIIESAASEGSPRTFDDSVPSCGDADVNGVVPCIDRCEEVATNTYGPSSNRNMSAQWDSEDFFKTKKCTCTFVNHQNGIISITAELCEDEMDYYNLILICAVVVLIIGLICLTALGCKICNRNKKPKGATSTTLVIAANPVYLPGMMMTQPQPARSASQKARRSSSGPTRTDSQRQKRPSSPDVSKPRRASTKGQASPRRASTDSQAQLSRSESERRSSQRRGSTDASQGQQSRRGSKRRSSQRRPSSAERRPSTGSTEPASPSFNITVNVTSPTHAAPVAAAPAAAAPAPAEKERRSSETRVAVDEGNKADESKSAPVDVASDDSDVDVDGSGNGNESEGSFGSGHDDDFE